jgi:hypothetical protein
MKYDNFPPFFHIVPVDKASACGLDGFGLYVVRVYAHQRDIDVFLSEADVYSGLGFPVQKHECPDKYGSYYRQ